MLTMPFTAAHAAAVLPFQRTILIPSALVVGCLSPDFEYFLRLAPRGGFGHTIPGILAMDLPLSVFVLWLYHAFAKKTVLRWLPASIRQRLYARSTFPSIPGLRFVLLVSISIVIGATTHVLWDSFTHPSFWPYQHWGFLRQTIELPVLGPMRCVKLLQHLSTIAGLVALAAWILNWHRHTEPVETQYFDPPVRNAGTVLVVLCIASIVAAILRGFLGAGIPANRHQSEVFLAEVVISAITFLWSGTVAYGMLMSRSARS
jgi:hypothetical protein